MANAQSPTNDLNTRQLSEQGIMQGAHMAEATLAGVPGRGTIQVIRGRRLDRIDVQGTWRPNDEDTDLSPVQKAVDAGEPMRFEGRMDDPAHPDRTTVEGDFVVSSFGDYAYDATLTPGQHGPTLRVFNLREADGTDVTGKADG